MRRILPACICFLFLIGCSSGQGALDAGTELRNNIQNAAGGSFQSVITADYGEEIYQFTMDCQFDQQGSLTFIVTEPESISGISGKIDGGAGSLTFDDHYLAFEMLADGQLTPVSAPWLMIKVLRCGYISACAKENDGFRLRFDDSYTGENLTAEVRLDSNKCVSSCEFLWDGRRILSLKVSDFRLL